jgi:hypothetical protein
MSIGIGTVVEAFDLLYVSLLSKGFSKSLKLHEWGERDLLPLVRTYLLGYFGESLVPEARAVLPGSLSGNGRLDFIVGEVAVEFVVRKPTAGKSNLSVAVNSSEVKKLMKYDGHALLVLFDFSKTAYTSEQIEAFRDWPSLGKGNHRKSPFNVAYFFIKSRRPIVHDVITKNIRVC